MSGQQHEATNGSSQGAQEPDFAQLLKELNKGERTAASLENHLDSVEQKIDELLKQAEADEKERDEKRRRAAEEAKGSTHG
ncbi:hypothetical protein LTS18_009849 [Coniosporium uncinatum]|uniref:Uncharacterized protein n=1 Tax=Coniosporium uncinatum TaxID=93489 RepID=A0ACC3D0E8_9PEZI|nr:hypothetical protein LTS18_009849 [Coniosporium uncinatum]